MVTIAASHSTPGVIDTLVPCQLGSISWVDRQALARRSPPRPSPSVSAPPTGSSTASPKHPPILGFVASKRGGCLVERARRPGLRPTHAQGRGVGGTAHALIGHCLSGSSITLVEGEGIHPSLARHHPVELVRFAFVVEPDQPILFQTLSRRSARFRALPEAHQHTVAATNWLYGNWLRQQAQQYGQPWVESRPWATLPDRLIQAWHQPTLEPRPGHHTP